MRHVLVATDDSPGAGRAVEFAAQLAKTWDATLKVLTIVEPPSAEAAEKLKDIEHVAESDMAEIVGRATLAHARERAQSAGFTARIQMQALGGDPTAEILSVAMRDNMDVIVVGKRGRGPLAGLLLGSVSQKLVTLATCPVIVVP